MGAEFLKWTLNFLKEAWLWRLGGFSWNSCAPILPVCSSTENGFWLSFHAQGSILPQQIWYFYIFCQRSKLICAVHTTPWRPQLLTTCLAAENNYFVSHHGHNGFSHTEEKQLILYNQGGMTKDFFLPPKILNVWFFLHLAGFCYIFYWFSEAFTRKHGENQSQLLKISSTFKNWSKLELSVYIKSRKLHYDHIM